MANCLIENNGRRKLNCLQGIVVTIEKSEQTYITHPRANKPHSSYV